MRLISSFDIHLTFISFIYLFIHSLGTTNINTIHNVNTLHSIKVSQGEDYTLTRSWKRTRNKRHVKKYIKYIEIGMEKKSISKFYMTETT